MSYNNIFVLSDGTANGYLSSYTNVLRLNKLLKAAIGKNSSFVTNHLRYFQGVGVQHGEGTAYLLKNFASADDIFDKINEIYRYISEKYNPDPLVTNRIWLFGFSRGAFTSRAVAELINRVGVIRLDYKGSRLTDKTWDALSLRAYHFLYARKEAVDLRAPVFYNDFSHAGSRSSVFFLGLWDTVGAVGTPDIITGYGVEFTELLKYEYISPTIKFAFHALATHENMATFEPIHIFKKNCSLDDSDDNGEENGEEKRLLAEQVIEERFFPGYHLDVGGYIGSQPIPDASLNWIIDSINRVPERERGFVLHFDKDKVLFFNDFINLIITIVYFIGRQIFTFMARLSGFLQLNKVLPKFLADLVALRDRFIPGVDKSVKKITLNNYI